MKKILVLLLLSPAFMHAQDTTRIYDRVQQMPTFKGDIPAYVRDHFVYPDKAMAKGIQGTVVISYIVEKDGSISGAHVMKNLDPSIDSAAVECISSMPRWNPGKLNGVAVRVNGAIPIRVSPPVIDTESVNPSTLPRIK